MIRNFYDTLKSLLPNGRAFRIPDGTQFRNVNEALGEEPDRIREYFDDTRDSGLPGKIPAVCFGEWETMLNLLYDSTLSDSERQARIMARIFAVGGQGAEYLEDALNLAGYPVKVYDPVLASSDQTGYLIPCAPIYEHSGAEKIITIPDYCFGKLDNDDIPTLNKCQAIATNDRGDRVIMAGEFRLYLSDDCGETWVETKPVGNVDKQWASLAMSADGQTIIAGIQNGRLYKTINGGTNWAETQPAGAVDRVWWNLLMSADGQTILAGAYGKRLYITINGGTNWTEHKPAGNIDANWNASASTTDMQIIIVGVSSGRLYKTINGGTNWAETQPAGNVNKHWQLLAMSADGQTILAGGYGERLYKTINGGTNWAETKPAGVADKQWYSGAVSPNGNIVYAFELAGLAVYKSYDAMVNWQSYNVIIGTESYRKIWTSPNGAITYFGDYNGTGSHKEFFYFKKIAIIADVTGQDDFLNIASNLRYNFFDTIYLILKPGSDTCPGKCK